ncbi:SDR family NAD(P)-dependent oxidoreductase [Microbacterium sp. BK668]|uniref:SDR family NAD(P)-dependent oxidoreductase n=1 Tax=Microbacterium sp. BK668 TaxID=2512118 RepID=UPI00106028B2|nr:SDR family NAD(P)-dependent oxidoreductase [Microbacterium sp. BK668]TDN91591.1 sorbitol-6-phosphate 2-dehydrogenase/meso-butanediol dehydrogenase/(S,S)-butanediol dehydrogenase/diacetyl reductase [Microbacterium sp. BK668]
MLADSTPRASLTGRTAIVTGGAGALGSAIARRFAIEGARVAIADLDLAATTAVADAIAADTGGEVRGIAVDVTDLDALDRTAAELETQWGVCDTIVPNAGVLALAPALDLSPREWNLALSVNLTGAFFTATAFARRLVAAGRPGTVTFTSSLFGVRGGRGNAAYSATKFGVIGLAQSLAADFAHQSVRVNAVCPGQIETAMLDDLFARRAAQNGSTASQEREQFESRIPLGRLGTVDEVARTFVYLASDESSYVTGQHIILDGGWQVG